ncbi:MAG TPA: hypothetical protein VIS96_16515 [Terrimicrobiaceae bacterium]
MPLPDDSDNVSWEGTVVILRDTAEGVPVFTINNLKYPQYPPGYFMMAITNGSGFA